MKSRTPPRARSLLFFSFFLRACALPEAPARPTLSPAENGFPTGAAEPPQVTPFAMPEPELRRRAVEPTLVTLDGYSYAGCYEDGSSPLAVTSEYDNGMTPELCRNLCSLAECPVFGVANGFECHCGKTLEPFAVSVVDSECTQACGGDDRDLCGAGQRLNVYSATVGFENLGKGGGNGDGGSSTSGGGGGGSGNGGSGANDGDSGDKSSPPGSKPSSTDGSSSSSNDGGDGKGNVTLSVGAIAGIAIGSAGVVAIVAGILACIFCLRKRNNNNQPAMMPPPSTIGGYQQDMTQQQPTPMQQYSNVSPQQQAPPQYGFLKPNESSPSYSNISPVSDPTGRSVSPLVAGGTAPPPPPPPGQGSGGGAPAHEMQAGMAYEMPGSVYQK